MILALTFTWPQDSGEAAELAKMLPAEWRRRWVVETRHAAAVAGDAAIAGAEVVCDDFNRGSSLRGLDAVRGVIRAIAGGFATSPDVEAVVKIDSDAALWDPDALVKPVAEGGAALCGVARGDGSVSGACYVVGRAGAEALRNVSTTELVQTVIDARGHEDCAVSAIIRRAGLPVRTYPIGRMNLWSHRRRDALQIFGHHF
ncbi:MAG: hypothetical protein LUD52_05250 [Opitutae bacterium]|nr:hypothetical protein [Opitutae bacterium]